MIMLKDMKLYCLLFLGVVSVTECAKILGVFHMPGRSHALAGSTLMRILAEKGHDVTVVACFKEKNPPKNYKEYILTGLFEELKKRTPNFFETAEYKLLLPIIFNFFSASMLENALNHTAFQSLMKSGEKFDVVIMEEFQTLGMKYVARHFDAPLITFSAIDSNEWTNPYQGNPDSPAYLPSLYLPQLSCEMSFLERALNSFFYVYSNLIRTFYTIPKQNSLLHKYYPDAPHLNDFIYNVSLVLVNFDPSVQEPLPKVPSLVSIGGFHIKKPQPLPKDLQDILDNAKNGVIYFSLGSTVQSKDMPKEKQEMFLRIFSKLKETVLWKFEAENLPGKPDNVIIRKWFPQNDILAHKNVKLFITHGGIFSTMEAVYHGIPLLALPVFAEQNLNAKRAAINGYAKCLPFREISEEVVDSYVKDLLTNPTYKDNVKRRSQIMTDKPMHPADAVNYWVEYVIRHKGAPHLRVAALKLSWYQYLLLDVVAFILLILLAAFYALRFSLKLLCKRNKNKKEKAS